MGSNNGNGRQPMTAHHLLPTSRGGTKRAENVKIVPAHVHEAWHLIFENRTPEECIQHIIDVWCPQDYITKVIICRKHAPQLVIKA